MHEPAILQWTSDFGSSARLALGASLGLALRAAMRDPTRMFPLWTAFSRGEPVRASELRDAAGAEFVTEAVSAELLIAVDVGEDVPWLRGSVCIVAAQVQGALVWVASDFDWYAETPQGVNGPSEATETVLSAIPPATYRSVLDMGCGSGALGVRRLLEGDTRLVASDVNPRALALTELTGALNDCTVRTVRSDFADAIDDLFDLVVCNPPFILGRPADRTVFRDSTDATGHAGLAHDIAPLLAPDGIGIYLTNWEYPLGGDDPLDVLGDDLSSLTECDALVVERAAVPVERYVEVFCQEPDARADWVTAFTKRSVAHIGTGLIVLRRRSDSATAQHTLCRDFDTPREALAARIGEWAVKAGRRT